MVNAFPKIFQLGTRQTVNLFDGPVEVTEKIDGSQFGFGRVNGEFITRSKGQQIFLDSCDKMFRPVMEHVHSVQDLVPDGMFFYGETLARPKHNILEYKCVPKNHLALFAVMMLPDIHYGWDVINTWAERLGVDVIPIIVRGEMKKEDLVSNVEEWLKQESYLGGHSIEGVVVKNYAQTTMIGNVIFPLVAAKYVSEVFKEKHQKGWKTGKDKFLTLCESYCTEARWRKSVQHLRDDGKLEGDPKDIGPLLKAINLDIIEEEKEEIKEQLWNLYGKDVVRTAVRGFPQWYKEELLKGEL